MTPLALRLTRRANAVSLRHEQVAREMWRPLYGDPPPDDVPITHVTNGVHTPSWDSAEADALWTTTCGAARWRGTMDTIERDLARVADTELWHMRTSARTSASPKPRRSEAWRTGIRPPSDSSASYSSRWRGRRRNKRSRSSSDGVAPLTTRIRSASALPSPLPVPHRAAGSTALSANPIGAP